jgi:proline iminopeptidase
MLDVTDGHRIHWEVHGAGKPVVVFHGGPGSGCPPWWLDLFDLGAYRVVLFDQRGCGRSVPHASTPVVDLSANTTEHLLADIEALRVHLGIERWLVLGASWGTTLALAYAQRHSERVSEMVLFSVTTTTRREVEWITRGVGRYFPAEWERFRNAVPSDRLVEAYNDRVLDPDPAVHEPAAREWCAWEDAHVAAGHDPRYDDPAFRLAFARLVTHYWRHGAWLEEGVLTRDVGRLDGIPAVLIHGRLDLSSPLDVPWALSRAWPSSELVVIDDVGHKGGPSMTAAIVAALDRFR